MLMKIATGIDWCRIEEGKIFQAFGKLHGLRHLGRAHQDGDNRNAGAQRRLNLEADEVGLAGYSSRAASAGTEPAPTDNDQQDVTLNNCFTYVGAKVLAERNIVDVHEDRILAIAVDEAIPNTTCHYLGIGTAV
jgi:hypothetical protein